jgi:hypothetical protein
MRNRQRAPLTWRFATLACHTVQAVCVAGATSNIQNKCFHNFKDRLQEELGRLAAHLHSRERRTLLLFYSDHLPPLNAVFANLRFADGLSAQQQPVP